MENNPGRQGNLGSQEVPLVGIARLSPAFERP
jgi:hypothetical protein